MTSKTAYNFHHHAPTCQIQTGVFDGTRSDHTLLKQSKPSQRKALIKTRAGGGTVRHAVNQASPTGSYRLQALFVIQPACLKRSASN